MKLKNIIIYILFIIFFTETVVCKNYDERRVLFGEQYEHIEKVSVDSESLLKTNYEEIKKTAQLYHSKYDQYPLEEPVFYREKAGSTVFYRVIFGIDASFPAFAIENLQLLLVEKNGKLFFLYACYLHQRLSGDGTVHSYIINTYQNISIVRDKDFFVLIVHNTTNGIDDYIDFNEESARTEYSGHGEATFYYLKDILKAADSKKVQGTEIAKIEVSPYCNVECGKTLIDSNCPFMYTIQNAFDGDTSTSYVEDSEDNGITISIKMNSKKILRIGLINGFAKNEKLYLANNRIKNFSLNGKNCSIADSYSKDFIFFTSDNSNIVTLKTTDLYSGSSYDDTCIAEIFVE